VDAEAFDEPALFGAIGQVRALLIGRRALVALGANVLTSDYDVWLHIDDIEALNRAVLALDLLPSHPPPEARSRGRYTLENGQKVDVLVARAHPTVDGVRVSFDELWDRRKTLEVSSGVSVALPCLDDLILTKRFGARPKDAEDIRTLMRLKARDHG